MVVLYVILALIAAAILLLALVLALPLCVRVVYKDTLSVYVGLSFIRIRILPKKEKKKKAKKKKTKIKQPEISVHKGDVKENTDTQKAEQKSKKPLSETLSLIFDIIKSFLDMMGKKSKIEIDELSVVVSKTDAADTAVQFGICNGIVTSLLVLTDGFGKAKIKSEKVSVCPDFISGKSTLSTDITLSAPTFSILWSVIRGYLRNQFKK